MTLQGVQYEFVDVKKTSTVDYTCDEDVNKVLYAAVRPHQETVMKDDQDPFVTSSTAAISQKVCC